MLPSLRQFDANAHLMIPRWVSRRIVLRHALLGERPRGRLSVGVGGARRMRRVLEELTKAVALHTGIAESCVSIEMVVYRPSRRELQPLPQTIRRTVYKRGDAAVIRVYVQYLDHVWQLRPDYVARLAHQIPRVERIGVLGAFCGDATHIDLAKPRNGVRSWTKN